jgi:acyl-CoA synthetase (AMP-forming)/AMP-acid ligase II
MFTVDPITGDIELTYAQIWDRCGRLLGALCALGMKPGDRIGIVGANCHRYVELYQAVPGGAMALVPLNQRHTDAELNYALADSQTRVLFTNRVIDGLPSCVEHVIDLEDGYEKLLRDAEPADFPEDLLDTTIAGLFYTGVCSASSATSARTASSSRSTTASRSGSCAPPSPKSGGKKRKIRTSRREPA